MNTIGFIGGDLRIVKLAELFQEENYKVYTYGLEKANFKYDNIKKSSIKEMIETTQTIISSIPLSKDGNFINSPFSKEKIIIEEIFSQIKGTKFISGAIKNEVLATSKKYNIEVIDVLEDESLCILNAIPTAEGAIQIAMEETRNNFE